jgi:hypothetical protein
MENQELEENKELVKNHHIYELDGRKYQCEIVEITPEIAKGILAADNFNNRPVNIINVKNLAKAMDRGDWVFDGSPIRFNDRGQLLDGRHRLSAIVLSGKTFKFLVLRDLDTETFKTMDTGRLRTGSDVFSIAGISNARNAASIVKFIYCFRNSLHSANRNSNRRLSNSELLDYYDDLNEEGNIDGSISFAKYHHSKTRLGNLPTFAGFHYLFSLINKEDADTFINKLCTGVMLEGNSPINTLRNKLITISTEKNTISTSAIIHANIILAWNKFRRSEKCLKLVLPMDVNSYNYDIL